MKKRIEDEVRSIDSQADPVKATAHFISLVSETSRTYEELSLIHLQRERYNIAWAFTYANETLQRLLGGVFPDQVKERIEAYTRKMRNRRKKGNIERKFHIIQRTLTEKVNKTRTSPKFFTTASVVIFSGEIALTLMIVYLVYQLATIVNASVSVPQLSVLSVGIFALLRFFLYRAKTRLLSSWSWNMYQDAVDSAFDGLAIVIAASSVLAYHVRQGTFMESKLDAVLERSLRHLQEPPSRMERRERRAQHQAARLKAFELERIRSMRKKIELRSLHETLGVGTRRTSTPLGTISIKAPKPKHPLSPLLEEEEVTKEEEARAKAQQLISSVDPKDDAGQSPQPIITEEAASWLKKNSSRVISFIGKRFTVHRDEQGRSIPSRPRKKTKAKHP